MAAGEKHTVALRSDGTLWAWGWNDESQLGLPGVRYQHSPAQVGTTSDWIAVTAHQRHTVALKAGGTLWAWGHNPEGQLGLGHFSHRQDSPAQVGTASDWIAVAAGGWSTVALKADGTLWAWGFNRRGELGVGNIALEPCIVNPGNLLRPVCSSTPLQVGTASDWIAVTAGKDHTLAIKRNGTLWAWGHSKPGALGLGTDTGPDACLYPTEPEPDQWCSFLPVQVGTATWKAGAMGDHHTLAIKADGALWAWGDNNSGRLGVGRLNLGRFGPRSHSRLQVGTASDWKAVGVGWYHSLAIKTNGTLWAWGDNQRGQLGLGTSAGPEACRDDRSGEVRACSTSPLRVGTASDWKAVAGGTYHTVAIKANGTLWAWGHNEFGQLGLGDTSNRTAPTQVR